jgi:hypothetical protein
MWWTTSERPVVFPERPKTHTAEPAKRVRPQHDQLLGLPKVVIVVREQGAQ